MRIKEFFRKVVLCVLICLIVLGIIMGTLGNIAHKSYLVAFVLSTLLATVVIAAGKRKRNVFSCLDRFSPGTVCLALSAFCLLINGSWVLIFHPVQAADYQTFFQTAVDLAKGIHPTGKDYVAMFPHILGYSGFLSVFLRIFGQKILVASIVNVFLTTATGILLYVLSLRWSGNRTVAAVVFLLWIVCPSKLLYNTMVLSEPYYSFLLVLFLLFVSIAFDRESFGVAVTTLIGLIAGIILALVNSARPIGIIPVVAFVIWFLGLTDCEWKKKKRKAGGLFLLALLICYVCVGRVWNSYAAGQLEQKTPSIPGYSIYVGFNPRTQGSYADEDMNLLQSRYFGEYNRDAQRAQKSMFYSAIERIRDNKKSIPSLMVHKIGTLLGHDEGGAFYSKESLSDKQYSFWCVISNIWYYFVCILAASGCLTAWAQNRNDSFWMVPLCFIGVILAQLLVEVAARYHYCLIPMLLLSIIPICGKRNGVK